MPLQGGKHYVASRSSHVDSHAHVPIPGPLCVGPRAEVDLVEIGLKNAVLAVAELQDSGDGRPVRTGTFPADFMM